VAWAVLGRAVLSRVSAVQGHEAECRGLVAEVHAAAGDRGWSVAMALAGTSAALLELGFQ